MAALDLTAPRRVEPAPPPVAVSCQDHTVPPVRAGSPSPTLALLKSLKQRGIPVVAVLLSGRRLWITPELETADAFVVAWLPGSEGAGVADVLLRKNNGAVNHDFTGRLSFSWPREADGAPVNRGDADSTPLFPYGFGLTYR